MGRNARRAAAGAVVGLMISVLLLAGARATNALADAGTRAIEYLQGQQSAADGSLPGGFSVNDLYAIGAAAGGYDPSLLNHGGPSVVDYLTANAASACPAAGSASASAGGCGELLQAVIAAARDPHSFGGLDLVARLTAYFSSSGKYGDGQAFTQALAIQGLVAAAQPVPAGALTFLHNAEDSDGGWDFQDIHDDPNAATNFDTSDSNSTAMVLMALDAAGDHSRDATALTWLHTLQNSDGGFSFQGGGSDPDSTALVLQAILASGGSPTGAAWTVGGHSPMSELVATQGTGGGYTFPGNPSPDAFTTSQVPPALASVTFPEPPASQLYTPGTRLGGQPPAPPTPSPTPPPGGPAGVVTPGAMPASSSTAAGPPVGVSLGRNLSATTASAPGVGIAAAPSVPPAAAVAPPAAAPPPVVAGPASPSPPRAVGQTPAPSGGPPPALWYALAAVGAAVLAAGAGYVLTRR